MDSANVELTLLSELIGLIYEGATAVTLIKRHPASYGGIHSGAGMIPVHGVTHAAEWRVLFSLCHYTRTRRIFFHLQSFWSKFCAITGLSTFVVAG